MALKLKVPIPENEGSRLSVLRNSKLMNYRSNNPHFDRFTSLTQRVLHTHIAVLTLVEEDRISFKSVSGDFKFNELPRNEFFCAYTVLTEQSDVVVIEDALLDDRVKDFKIVTDEPKIRFYAGTAIMLENVKIGSLCVMDTSPRKNGEFTTVDRMNLLDLGVALSAIVKDQVNSLARSSKNNIEGHELYNGFDPLSTAPAFGNSPSPFDTARSGDVVVEGFPRNTPQAIIARKSKKASMAIAGAFKITKASADVPVKKSERAQIRSTSEHAPKEEPSDNTFRRRLSDVIGWFPSGTTPIVSEKEREPRALRVLLCEDSISAQKLMLKWLDTAGCAVTVANNGKQGLKYITSKEFDICFVDFLMPVMSGVDLISKFKDWTLDVTEGHGDDDDFTYLNRDVLIIGMSDGTLTDEMAGAFMKGMHFFLPKPVKQDQLLAILKIKREAASLEEARDKLDELATSTDDVAHDASEDSCRKKPQPQLQSAVKWDPTWRMLNPSYFLRRIASKPQGINEL